MNLQAIKTFLWKWTKRLLVGTLAFSILIVVLAQLFGHKVDPNQKIEDQVVSTGLTDNISSGTILVQTGETSKRATDLANTGVSATGGVTVPMDPLKLLSEAKKKEIYLKYREIQDIPVDKIFAGVDRSKMTDQDKAGYIGKYIHKKEEELAQENKLAWEDIDKVVGEAIQKGWNLEVEPKVTGAISKEDRQILLDYIKDERGLLVTRCKTAVKARLKSPSSADFSFSDYTLAVVQDTILVKTYVDADNEFGANIRSTVECYFDYNSGDATIREVEMY